MDMTELAAGLENVAAEQGNPEMPPEAPAWEPSMDWLMNSVGPFFNNNKGLGELLLDKLKETGINTEGVALAGLVNVLQQFSQEYKALGEAVGDNLDKINSLSSQSEDLASAIQDVLKEMNVPKDEGANIPAGNEVGDIAMAGLEGAGGEMPPDLGAAGGEMPPMDAGMPPAGGDMPPDMGAAPMPDAGGAGDMPPDMGGAPAGGDMPPDPNMVSDARVKNVVSDETVKNVVKTAPKKKGILSDSRLKRVAKHYVSQQKNSTRLNNSFIDACSGGF